MVMYANDALERNVPVVLLIYLQTHLPSGLQAAGYCGELTAAIGLYIAFANLLNETWFRGQVGRYHCLLLLRDLVASAFFFFFRFFVASA